MPSYLLKAISQIAFNEHETSQQLILYDVELIVIATSNDFNGLRISVPVQSEIYQASFSIIPNASKNNLNELKSILSATSSFSVTIFVKAAFDNPTFTFFELII